MRLLFSCFFAAALFLSGVRASAAEPTLPPFHAALRDARAIHTLLAAAIAAPDPLHPSLGTPLATYAKNTGTDPVRYEGFEAASRRIVAGRPAEKIAPDATGQRLTAIADSLAAHLRSLEALRLDLRPDNFSSAAPVLHATALLARFHVRRIHAAIHYNLFLRGQRLAELYAATLDAQAALAHWRDLVALLGDRETLTFGTPPLTLRGAWRAELARLEFDYKDLEAMCCPPDESWVREKVWSPATTP
jgi:hypothetical protein